MPGHDTAASDTTGPDLHPDEVAALTQVERQRIGVVDVVVHHQHATRRTGRRDQAEGRRGRSLGAGGRRQAHDELAASSHALAERLDHAAVQRHQTAHQRQTEAETAAAGLQAAARSRPDLILLDLGLPDGDGFGVLREIRGWSAVPVIVLSARGREADKVAALDGGADDYLTKPFLVGELLARIRVALRHARRAEPEAPTIRLARRNTIAVSGRRFSVVGRTLSLGSINVPVSATAAKACCRLAASLAAPLRASNSSIGRLAQSSPASSGCGAIAKRGDRFWAAR